ncbi:DNA cytosine methyltransferase [Clostridium sp. Marseille-P299]|uniref:DNA cytosine methyltransferase n=1 Tax=Clostridium sp. Marseille-P299 TaxID=1805477 RepID=UPI00082B5D19|nr:DNA cytosine methyltransferase [Clostridium sp. Marseille-P299]
MYRKNVINFIDLFAGAGGLSEGFMQCRYNPIAHVEMNTYAADTLKTRSCYYYLKKMKKLDIYINYLLGNISKQELYNLVPSQVLETVINTEISDKTYKTIFERIDHIMEEGGVVEVDLIIGGPPCQAYSLVGRASAPGKMIDDPRNDLYIQYARFLHKYKPKMFVFENVPGMLTAKQGLMWKRIQQRLRTVGYEIESKEINANDFGVLQRRKRIIIIGWRKDLNLYYPKFVKRRYNAVVNDLFSDLPPLQPGETNNNYLFGPINDYLSRFGIRNENDILTDHQTRKLREQDRKIYRMAIEMWNDGHKRLNYNDLPQDLRFHKNTTSFLDRFKVVEGDMGYSHTMLAHISKDGHYYIHPDVNQCRSLSVREAARIQSFPDNYYFEGPRTAKFVQIGNAVPPLMAKGIAETIKKMLLMAEPRKE